MLKITVHSSCIYTPPTAEQSEWRKQSKAKAGNWSMKAREVRMASCCNCEVAVRMTEKKLTPHIICTELILCAENSLF